jgi:hypothetical protein
MAETRGGGPALRWIDGNHDFPQALYEIRLEIVLPYPYHLPASLTQPACVGAVAFNRAATRRPDVDPTCTDALRRFIGQAENLRIPMVLAGVGGSHKPAKTRPS